MPSLLRVPGPLPASHPSPSNLRPANLPPRRPFTAASTTPPQVEVEAWRATLWRAALARQGREDDAAAARLQHCFSSTRLEHFRFGAGVEAMVQRLQGLGLATLIISNGHRSVQVGARGSAGSRPVGRRLPRQLCSF